MPAVPQNCYHFEGIPKCISYSGKSRCLTAAHSKAAHTTTNYDCGAGEYKQRHESVDFKEFHCICVIGQGCKMLVAH
jgi:hypothetical protein